MRLPRLQPCRRRAATLERGRVAAPRPRARRSPRSEGPGLPRRPLGHRPLLRRWRSHHPAAIPAMGRQSWRTRSRGCGGFTVRGGHRLVEHVCPVPTTGGWARAPRRRPAGVRRAQPGEPCPKVAPVPLVAEARPVLAAPRPDRVQDARRIQTRPARQGGTLPRAGRGGTRKAITATTSPSTSTSSFNGSTIRSEGRLGKGTRVFHPDQTVNGQIFVHVRPMDAVASR